MRVLLVDPPGIQKGLNAGLGYLAASLKDCGHEVKVLDLNNNRSVSMGEFKGELEEYSPQVVGYSMKAITVDTAISNVSRKVLPDSLHVAGGPEVTLFYEDFLRNHPQFDVAFVGEAENTICNVVEHFGKDKKFSGIEGISYRENGHITKNKPVFIEELDELAFPDFTCFTNINETLKNVEYAYPLLTSRGCPYTCVFCSVGSVSGRKWRARSPKNLIDELKHAQEVYNIKDFTIVDDNFTFDVERAKTFCRMLIDAGQDFRFRLNNGIRTDRIDEELASLMFEAGCNLVMVGVESGDPKVFESVGKGEKLKDVKRGIKILKDAGIWVGGYFIIGLPGDTPESIRNTIDFIKEVGLDHAHFNVLVPYPKTRAWDWVSENGKFLKDYKEGLHFEDDTWIVDPVFETKEFTRSQMIEAYELANTQLSQFNFLIPKDLGRANRFTVKTKLIWRYDKSSIPKRIFDYTAHKIMDALGDHKAPSYSR